MWEALKEIVRNPPQPDTAAETQPPFPPSPDDIQALQYDTFEELVAALYLARGYTTELTQDGADRGVDVLVSDSTRTVAIQAKRYSKGNRVGVRPVRQIVGAAAECGADNTAVATTSTFTAPAEETAGKLDVTLINGERCCKLIANSPPWVRETFGL